MGKFIISCREAQSISPDPVSGRVKLSDSVSLFIHNIMCSACRRADKHFAMIKKILAETQPEAMPPQIKGRMKVWLRKQILPHNNGEITK